MAVEERVMDALLHQLAARHPGGGRGLHCRGGLTRPSGATGRDLRAPLCRTPGVGAAAIVAGGPPGTAYRYALAGFGRSFVHEG